MIVRATSFGVRRRRAPSTIEIILSRKESPGSTLILAISRSESTRVPPTIAEFGPPGSRITGADSPVTADSSTDATPSITSASAAITSPGSIRMRSPFFKFSASTSSGDVTSSTDLMRFARISRLVPRSAIACARPRSSASASEKFANQSVIQSQIMSDIEKKMSWACLGYEC